MSAGSPRRGQGALDYKPTAPHSSWKARTFVAIVLAFPLALCAQWPLYPTSGVPRTASGAPDLNAPAPKTAWGKPDLSGIWRNTQPALLGEFGAPAPPRDPNALPTGLDMFRDIGIGVKDGWPLQPWA